MQMQLHLLKAKIYRRSYPNKVYTTWEFIWSSNTPYSTNRGSWYKKKLKNRWE